MKKNTLYKNIALKKYNSWKVGGTAEKLYICADKELLSEGINHKRITPPFTFIGLGKFICFFSLSLPLFSFS